MGLEEKHPEVVMRTSPTSAEKYFVQNGTKMQVVKDHDAQFIWVKDHQGKFMSPDKEVVVRKHHVRPILEDANRLPPVGQVSGGGAAASRRPEPARGGDEQRNQKLLMGKWRYMHNGNAMDYHIFETSG